MSGLPVGLGGRGRIRAPPPGAIHVRILFGRGARTNLDTVTPALDGDTVRKMGSIMLWQISSRRS